MCGRSGPTGKHLVDWREAKMESFDNFEKIGNKTENLALENGKIKKKISWERVGGGGGGGGEEELAKEQAGEEQNKGLEQVHFYIINVHYQHIAQASSSLLLSSLIIDQGGVRQVSFQAPSLQKPEVITVIIIT